MGSDALQLEKLTESNGSILPDGWLKVTCTLGSAPGPMLGNEYGRTFNFFFPANL